MDTIFEIEGGGIDLLDFSAADVGVTIDLSLVGIQTVVIDILKLKLLQAEVENVTGGSGNDSLTGSDANNVRLGGDGNDPPSGAAGE